MWKLCLGALTAAVAVAQNAPAPPLNLLEQTARQTAADWDRLAQGLNASIRGLLPCDPKELAAISRVRQASDARLSALADYLQAAAEGATRQTEAARRLLVSGEGLASNLEAGLEAGLEAEKSEIALGLAGTDAPLSNLTESAKGRAALSAPLIALQQIRSELQRRADLLQTGLQGRESRAEALRNLVASAEAREAAWKDVQAAYESEQSRWTAYYTARLARARTECSITRNPAPPPSKGKQP